MALGTAVAVVLCANSVGYPEFEAELLKNVTVSELENRQRLAFVATGLVPRAIIPPMRRPAQRET